jgi:hypothetical protein
VAVTGWEEGQHVADVCDILWATNCTDRVAAVFKTYFDESWDQHQKKILVIGGMIGRYEQWSKIEWPWKELLEKYEIKYYRASEAEFARGEFNKEPFRSGENPSTSEQYRLLERVREDFFHVITRGIVSGLAIGVPLQEFNQAANTPEKLKKFGGTPYYICGHVAMLAMLKAEKEVIRSKELVAFIFDRQQEFDAEMLKVHANLDTAACEYHSQVGSIVFDDKKRFIPLQVADTLVYESRKYLERKIIDPNAVPRREMQRLMDEEKIFQISLCDKEYLESYLTSSTEQ